MCKRSSEGGFDAIVVLEAGGVVGLVVVDVVVDVDEDFVVEGVEIVVGVVCALACEPAFGVKTLKLVVSTLGVDADATTGACELSSAIRYAILPGTVASCAGFFWI